LLILLFRVGARPRQLNRSVAISLMPIQYFIWSAIIEGLALTPVAIEGIGHAGPNGILTGISFLLNLPGMLFVGWISSHFHWDFSWPVGMFAVFVVQTAALWLFGLLVTWLHRTRGHA